MMFFMGWFQDLVARYPDIKTKSMNRLISVYILNQTRPYILALKINNPNYHNHEHYYLYSCL